MNMASKTIGLNFWASSQRTNFYAPNRKNGVQDLTRPSLRPPPALRRGQHTMADQMTQCLPPASGRSPGFIPTLGHPGHDVRPDEAKIGLDLNVWNQPALGVTVNRLHV